MSVLNEIKNLSKKHPNDLEFGAEVRHYLDMHKTCCDNKENHVEFEDLDTHPYGQNFKGTKCKSCGKIIDCKITR